MAEQSRVYLDTSALFASLWSSTGGARLFLKLGEAGAVQLLVSPQVLAEIETVLRKKAPELLGYLALILDRCHVETVPSPGEDILSVCQVHLDHPGDAQVIAAARGSRTDYFVTLDRKHFVENQGLAAASPFPIGTPGDFLIWFRHRVSG